MLSECIMCLSCVRINDEDGDDICIVFKGQVGDVGGPVSKGPAGTNSSSGHNPTQAG